MLSTTKEVEDTADGKETRDMTRAQVLKAAFRVLTLKLGKAKVPMVVTNHTYDVVGSMFPTKEMGGGSGLKYAASSIVYLSKKKEKDGTEVVGNIVHCKNAKSRLTWACDQGKSPARQATYRCLVAHNRLPNREGEDRLPNPKTRGHSSQDYSGEL